MLHDLGSIAHNMKIIRIFKGKVCSDVRLHVKPSAACRMDSGVQRLADTRENGGACLKENGCGA